MQRAHIALNETPETIVNETGGGCAGTANVAGLQMREIDCGSNKGAQKTKLKWGIAVLCLLLQLLQKFVFILPHTLIVGKGPQRGNSSLS